MGSVIRNPNQILFEALKKKHSNFKSFRGKSNVFKRAKCPQAKGFHTYYIDRQVQDAKSNKTNGVQHHFIVLRTIDALKRDAHIRQRLTINLSNVIMEHDDSRFLTDEFEDEWRRTRLIDCGMAD